MVAQALSALADRTAGQSYPAVGPSLRRIENFRGST